MPNGLVERAARAGTADRRRLFGRAASVTQLHLRRGQDRGGRGRRVAIVIAVATLIARRIAARALFVQIR